MLSEIIEYCLNEATIKGDVDQKTKQYMNLLQKNIHDKAEFYKIFKRMRLDPIIKKSEKLALQKPKRPPIKPRKPIVDKYVKLLKKYLPEIGGTNKPTIDQDHRKFKDVISKMKKDKNIRRIELFTIANIVDGPFNKTTSIKDLYLRLEQKFVGAALTNSRMASLNGLTPW